MGRRARARGDANVGGVLALVELGLGFDHLGHNGGLELAVVDKVLQRGDCSLKGKTVRRKKVRCNGMGAYS